MLNNFDWESGDQQAVEVAFAGAARIVNAAEHVIDKGSKIAAHMLEAAVADIEFNEGQFSITGTDRRLDLFAVARAARDPDQLPAELEPGLDAEGSFTSPAGTFPNGCHVCEVEIDPATGMAEIVNYTAVDDFSAVINPLLLTGQVHGGIAQGVGQALYECGLYDEAGQLLTGSFMDYTMPRADSVPSIHFNMHNVPCTTNPLGLKGAGEAGAIGAPPAVVSAFVDALHPLTGIQHIDMPITAQKIWRLLQTAQDDKSACGL